MLQMQEQTAKELLHIPTVQEAEKLRQDPESKGVELTKEEREAVLRTTWRPRDTNIFDTLDYDLRAQVTLIKL